MQLSTSHKVYVAILAIAVAAFVGDRLLRDSGSTPPGPAQAKAGPPPGGAVRPPAPPAAPSPGRPSLADRLEALEDDPDLDPTSIRDAFVPADAWLAELKVPEPDTSEPSLAEKFAASHEVTAVLLAGSGGCAVVNGKVVQIGQVLDGFELVGLARERATFQVGQERVELRLRPQEGGPK